MSCHVEQSLSTEYIISQACTQLVSCHVLTTVLCYWDFSGLGFVLFPCSQLVTHQVIDNLPIKGLGDCPVALFSVLLMGALKSLPPCFRARSFLPYLHFINIMAVQNEKKVTRQYFSSILSYTVWGTFCSENNTIYFIKMPLILYLAVFSFLNFYQKK